MDTDEWTQAVQRLATAWDAWAADFIRAFNRAVAAIGAIPPEQVPAELRPAHAELCRHAQAMAGEEGEV